MRDWVEERKVRHARAISTLFRLPIGSFISPQPAQSDLRIMDVARAAARERTLP